MGQHRHPPFGGCDIGAMTCQWDAERCTNRMRCPLVVGVTVRQGDQRGAMIPELTEDPTSAPSGRSIDQHIPKQIDVEIVGRKTGKLPDAFCDFLHQ